MKRAAVFLLAIILISVGLSYAVIYYSQESSGRNEFFFGVSFGQQTAAEAKVMIDKVKGYTNFFLINNWDIATNETALNEVCDYVAQSGLKFIVFFDLISRKAYPWHQTWLETAKERWGDKFLGVHLRDELGGKQIDVTDQTVMEAADYSDAANRFVSNIISSNNMVDAKSKGVPVFISDYALYWFDYLAGYDTVFVELGWNHSTPQHIALCRGAAKMQGKDWGTIIVHTYRGEPPQYLASGTKILEDMTAAYRAGAKYVVVFDYAEDETGKPYSTLTGEHFTAMQQFWAYVNDNPDEHGATVGQVAFVLPKDYGWGMRSATDNMWGLWWSADEKAPVIWESMNKLIQKYGLELDIVYDDDRFNVGEKYSTVYYWNATIE